MMLVFTEFDTGINSYFTTIRYRSSPEPCPQRQFDAITGIQIYADSTVGNIAITTSRPAVDLRQQ
jgi:hypothetical protein